MGPGSLRDEFFEDEFFDSPLQPFFTVSFKYVMQEDAQGAVSTVSPNTVSPNLCSPKHIDSKKNQQPPGNSFLFDDTPSLFPNSIT